LRRAPSGGQKVKLKKNLGLTCQLVISTGSLMRLTVDGARSFRKNQYLRFFLEFLVFLRLIFACHVFGLLWEIPCKKPKNFKPI